VKPLELLNEAHKVETGFLILRIALFWRNIHVQRTDRRTDIPAVAITALADLALLISYV